MEAAPDCPTVLEGYIPREVFLIAKAGVLA